VNADRGGLKSVGYSKGTQEVVRKTAVTELVKKEAGSGKRKEMKEKTKERSEERNGGGIKKRG